MVFPVVNPHELVQYIYIYKYTIRPIGFWSYHQLITYTDTKKILNPINQLSLPTIAYTSHGTSPWNLSVSGRTGHTVANGDQSIGTGTAAGRRKVDVQSLTHLVETKSDPDTSGGSFVVARWCPSSLAFSWCQ